MAVILKHDIEKLNFLVEHSHSKSMKRYYTTILLNLIDIYNEVTDSNESYEFRNQKLEFLIKQSVNNDKVCYKEIALPNYIDMIAKLCGRSLAILEPYNSNFYFNVTFSLEEAKELVLEFYNNYDPSLYDIVKKALDKEHLFILSDKFYNGEGYSYYNSYYDNPYIVIYIDDKINIENIICLAHEMGHIINFYKSKRNMSLYDIMLYNNFIEIPSCTFERLFIEFLIKNKICKQEAEQVISNNLFSFKARLNSLLAVNSIIGKINLEDIDNPEKLLEQAESFSDDLDLHVIEQEIENISNCYKYSFGGILSHYYFYLIKKDEEKGKSYFENFCKSIGIANDLYMLNNFGIDLENLLKMDYLKEEVERNQKQLEFYKKNRI